MARAEISKTPPGLMFGPSWRVGPSCVVSKAPDKGPHPSLISPGWGLRSLRLLEYGSWGQCRLCLCRQVWRMSICSPGSVCIISLKCTELDPRPVRRYEPWLWSSRAAGAEQGLRKWQAAAMDSRAQGCGRPGLSSAGTGHGGTGSGLLVN